ncbi:MAG: large conductance mechanosensitive channel protein MscL [Actinomycetota bacterium]
MLKDFRAFVLRGNVVDLAVGVVIGAAFGAIVNAIVNGLINPLISFASTGALQDKVVCVGQKIVHNKVVDPCVHPFRWGSVLSAMISFIIIAAVVFFLVVKPLNRLTELFKSDMPSERPTRDCPFCLSSIPITASRCAFCTSEVPQPV